MQNFSVYFEIGYRHILDIRGYDHILFIVVLCAVYTLAQWKQTVWLATAFSLGHSLTLAIVALGLLNYDKGFAEIAIWVSILFVGLSNLFVDRKTTIYKDTPKGNLLLRYGMAFIFGLVHGLGFSSYLQDLLSPSQSIIIPLLAFNVGLEAGQFLVILVLMLLGSLGSSVLHIRPREWNIGLSMLSVGMILNMLITRFYA